MHCFDSETELESHELGRSLLYMIRNDDAGLPGFYRHEPINVPANPFADLRERLAAVDLAIHDLHPQVKWSPVLICRHYTGCKFRVSFVLEFTHFVACFHTYLRKFTHRTPIHHFFTSQQVCLRLKILNKKCLQV
jgi:hypothetical protein